MSGDFRFDPPPEPISGETARALLTAFGPEPAMDGHSEAIDRAFRLGLAERIWSRWRSRQDAAGIPPASIARFERSFRRTVANGLVHEDTANELAAAAAGLGVSIIFLKGHALALGGMQEPGSRPYADLDVLASEHGGSELARTLGERNWQSPPVAANEQHLPALRSPRGGVVEIHFRLRGVRVAASPWASAAELAGAGELTPVAALPGDCSIPSRNLLAAHLLVHGIEQHGHRPHTYPLLRMIGDLADLLPDADARRDFAARFRSAIAGAVSEEETAAALDLVAHLTGGGLPSPAAGAAGHADRLLRHFVAGSLNADYARSLAFGHLTSRLGTAARRGHLGGYIRRKFWPQDQGASGIAGLRATLGRLGRGIARLGRAAGGRLRLSGRPRTPRRPP